MKPPLHHPRRLGDNPCTQPIALTPVALEAERVMAVRTNPASESKFRRVLAAARAESAPTRPNRAVRTPMVP
jgi:hypothetical protein